MNKNKLKKTIIFVTGGPGTGKSYASDFLVKHLEPIDLVSYDQIKEKEWDRFGFDNAKQKERLNWFSLEEFYLTLQKKMWEGKNILTEYPFYQRHREELAKLVDQYGYCAITVLLYGDWKKIYERGRERDHSDDRHPGHLTETYHIETFKKENRADSHILSYEEFMNSIKGKDYDIQIGTTIRIDVSDLSQIHYDEILDYIEKSE